LAAAEGGQLVERVAGAVKDYAAVERRVDAAALDLTVTAEAWANVARAGNYAKPHVHPNCNISGVYYVDVGDAPPDDQHSGVIEFLDPRQRPGMFLMTGYIQGVSGASPGNRHGRIFGPHLPAGCAIFGPSRQGGSYGPDFRAAPW
jgi:hypothetical protein